MVHCKFFFLTIVKRENNQENKEIAKVKISGFKPLGKYFSPIVLPTCITKSLLFASDHLIYSIMEL